ncbi:DUF2812 domain-containing protein [Neobacillus soli]|uniref:DUF2812 domain-containing protein n=1 Tax=Neobacillus soli TaxID=220688 RepID=UPI000825CA4D|nr:DUF2812 domain-containing protein [Neobacillus soli]
MIKKVFRPFWSYDVQKTEEWLSSMAEKGYFLIRINRGTRCFFFQQGEPKKLTYRIGYDKMQGEALSKGLLSEGWTKVLQSGNWFVTANEKPLDQIKTSSVREGIIKHNRVIMYIFGGILSYFAITAMIFLSILSVAIFSPDSQVEVVESPYWIFTYIYFGAVLAILTVAIYSVIKIHKNNKNLIREKTNQNIDHSKSLLEGRLPKEEEKQLKRSGQMIVKRKLGWMYAPDRLETWLETMELKGLNLYRVSKAGTFYFVIGHPRHVSYCADYQNIAEESYFDIHREAGWKMVFNSLGSLQKWSIWSREYAENEARPQIYSDKSHQLKHAKRIAITYSCLFLPLIIAYIFNIGFRIEIMSLRGLGKIDIIGMIIMLLAILSFGSYSVRTWLYYWRLKKRLDINF